MNLPPKVVRQIERGVKTQHRVLVAKTARKPEIGGSLVVQHAVEHEDETKRLPQVRVIVTDLTTTRVGDITTDQARAEGHGSLAEFASDWMRRHDPQWPPLTEALCKECQGHKHYENHHGETVQCDHCDEVGTIEIPDAEALADTDLILARFQRRHAHHLVYVITFVLQVDVTRFLNRRAHLPPTTSLAEALDPEAPLLGPPSKEWKQRAEALHREGVQAQDGALLAGLDRVAADLEAETQLLALLTNVDPSHDLFVIKQRLNKLRRKIEERTERRAA